MALAIYTCRGWSDAHLNPAVSLAMVLTGRLPARRLPVYVLAQFAGAFLAAALLYGLFGAAIAQFEILNGLTRGAPESIRSAMIFGEYFPPPTDQAVMPVTETAAFLAEMIGTFFLAFFILVLTDERHPDRPHAQLVPLLIGAVVAVIICLVAPLTQAGLNPARDFGPRVLAYLAGWKAAALPGPSGGFFTVYILGPLAGGTAAAGVFKGLLAPLIKGGQS